MRTKFFPRKGITAEKSLLLAAIGMVVFLVALSTVNANWVQTPGASGRNIYALAVRGSNIFAGTNGGGVFRSTNNGVSWIAVNNGLTVNTAVNAFAVSGNGYIFAGTERGIFLSTNNGTNWTAVNNGLTDTIVWSLVVNDSNIFAGTLGGVFLSTNSGTIWSLVKNGLPAVPVLSLAVSGSNIFAGTNNRVYLSTNNGAIWKWAYIGLPINTIVSSLAVSGNGDIFAGSILHGVFLSTDTGTTWRAVNSGLTDSTINALAISRSLIFAGIQGKGVFLSTDNGTTWKAINDGLTNNDVLSLALNDSTIFAGTAGGGVWHRPLSEIVTPVKLSVKVKYDYFAGGVTYHVFSWNPVSGAAWYDLYGNNVRFSHVLSQPRDSLKVSIGTISDSIEKETGKTIKQGDTLTYYLVARSSTNQILAVSNFVRMPFEFLVGTRPPKNLQKAPAIRIFRSLIDCSSLKGTVRIALYSLRGEKVWWKNGFGIKTMVPDQLPRGVYTVEVIGAFGKASRVVVRE